MKTIRIIAAIAAAFLLIAPAPTSKAQSLNLASVASALTGSNGTSAGAALLGLYTQYKADVKFDLGNASNISNLITLANNVKGLKNGTAKTDTSSFLTGLISGSKNLVNNNNSTSVLNSLSSIANLDLSSLGTAAATAAATKAKTGLLAKLTGKSSNTEATTTNAAASQAGSILTSLFKTLE